MFIITNKTLIKIEFYWSYLEINIIKILYDLSLILNSIEVKTKKIRIQIIKVEFSCQEEVDLD